MDYIDEIDDVITQNENNYRDYAYCTEPTDHLDYRD